MTVSSSLLCAWAVALVGWSAVAVAPRVARAAEAAAATTPAPAARSGGAKSKTRAKRGKAGAPAPAAAVGKPVQEPSAFAPTAPQVAKEFEELRRQQLVYAESAARGADIGERWETVLFHLSGLDSESYPTACFWRTIAYYRMGNVARGDSLRQTCALPSSDLSVLEREDTAARARQPAAALPGLGDAPGAGARRAGNESAPARDDAPYKGPGPTLKADAKSKVAGG